MASKKKGKSPTYVVENNHPVLWYFEWLDHASMSDGGWVSLKDLDESLTVVPVISVGWVMSEDEDQILIVPHYDKKNKNTIGAFTVIKRNIIFAKKLPDPHKWED